MFLIVSSFVLLNQRKIGFWITSRILLDAIFQDANGIMSKSGSRHSCRRRTIHTGGKWRRLSLNVNHSLSRCFCNSKTIARVRQRSGRSNTDGTAGSWCGSRSDAIHLNRRLSTINGDVISARCGGIEIQPSSWVVDINIIFITILLIVILIVVVDFETTSRTRLRLHWSGGL